MPITRTPILNDDGSGTVGTVWENGWKTELYNQIDAADAAVLGAPRTTPIILSTYFEAALAVGTYHNYNPAGSADKPVWYLAPAQGGVTITGIAAAAPGTIHYLFDTLYPLTLKHQDAGSLAANRLIGPGYGDFTLQPWQIVQIMYSHIHSCWLVQKF